MRNLIYLSLFCAAPAFARELELPGLSPAAKVMQTAGLTELTVEYSSPGVRGRPIWGALVPYGEVWRTGANRATKVTFSKDVTFGTTLVPAGSYAFFVIPQKTGAWTAILNKDFNQGGAFNYKKEQDVVRMDIKPEAIPSRERLAYSFVNFTNESGQMLLEWEKVRLSVPFTLGTDKEVTASIQDMQDDMWKPFNRAARYELEQKKDYDLALKLVDSSLKQKEEWFNTWTKAQVLAAKGNYKEAYPLAQKAQTLGDKAPKDFFYSDEVKAALKDWKAKS